jgi:hypothetical protein
MKDLYPLGDGLMLPHPAGYVGSYYITYVKGAGMRVRIVNVPGSNEESFVAETADYLCPCGQPAIYHFTVVDGVTVVTYITMDSHEALHFMINPEILFDNPTHATLPAGEDTFEEVELLGMLSGSDTPMVPVGEQLESVIAECVDFLEENGAESETFDTDRVKAAEVYGSSDAMFNDFQKLLEGETGA